MRSKRIGFLIGIAGFLLILFFPIPEIKKEAQGVLAVAFLMATLWITEAIPIPVTSLLPLLLFPIMKITSAQDASLPYADRNVFLFIGGFFIAKAIEKHNLHRRIALKVMLALGRNPRKLVLGFMFASSFLSMWISNTATTMMMLPIAIAIASQMNRDRNFSKALFIGLAYAASIGGVGTLVGTPPNMILAGQLKRIFPDAVEISFFKWLTLGIPFVLIFLPIAWLLLTRVLFPIRNTEDKTSHSILKKTLEDMGPTSKGERITLFVFVLTAILWIFRRDIHLGLFVIPGWSGLLGVEKYVHDSTVAISGAILLFLIPIDREMKEFALDWETAVKIPWGIVLLFGGGFSLANAFQTSGLSEWIGYKLGILRGLPHPLIVIGVALLMTFLTELTSNTASATLMLPILASIAVGLNLNPLLLMIPATLSSSCAFMLPVATPPNAIVFGSGYIKMRDMAKAGILLNFIGVIIVTIIVYTIVIPVFSITPNVLPAWSK